MLLMFFVKKLYEIREANMEENKEIDMTDDCKCDFKDATHCFICGDKFGDSYKHAKRSREV